MLLRARARLRFRRNLDRGSPATWLGSGRDIRPKFADNNDLYLRPVSVQRFMEWEMGS